jgi:hypothetical protein
MPWFICEMRRESGFEKCEPLFIEQDRMMAAEDWDAAEMPWKRMRTTLNLYDDESQPPIDEYLLRIHGRRDAPPLLNPALSRGRESERVPEHLEFVEKMA